mmetsp:Transcript_1939/g.2229  ORF Transcript_1939/g.2229 Transcript_1939/m.2229 type:complete len:311 (+) Transcript_1939:157-1089(+)
MVSKLEVDLKSCTGLDLSSVKTDLKCFVTGSYSGSSAVVEGSPICKVQIDRSKEPVKLNVENTSFAFELIKSKQQKEELLVLDFYCCASADEVNKEENLLARCSVPINVALLSEKSEWTLSDFQLNVLHNSQKKEDPTTPTKAQKESGVKSPSSTGKNGTPTKEKKNKLLNKLTPSPKMFKNVGKLLKSSEKKKKGFASKVSLGYRLVEVAEKAPVDSTAMDSSKEEKEAVESAPAVDKTSTIEYIEETAAPAEGAVIELENGSENSKSKKYEQNIQEVVRDVNINNDAVDEEDRVEMISGCCFGLCTIM